MNKTIYIIAGLLLAFASADSTPRPKSTIKMFYQEQPNGDYRLYLFGANRALVCEEKSIQIVEQGDAVNPLVIECKH